MQDCSISIANAMEILHSCTGPSTWCCIQHGNGECRPWTWWRHQMETFSALLTFCAGNSLVTDEFPSQRPVTQSFDVFFDLHLDKQLSKQLWGWWFETPSCPLWHHRSDILNSQKTSPYLTLTWKESTVSILDKRSPCYKRTASYSYVIMNIQRKYQAFILSIIRTLLVIPHKEFKQSSAITCQEAICSRSSWLMTSFHDQVPDSILPTSF